MLTPADYLKESSFTRLTAQGKKLAEQHRATLAAIEKQFGVPPGVVLAIWGRETVLRRLSTAPRRHPRAGDASLFGRRKDMFRGEFLAALKMLQDGIPRAQLRSSWGGAMGLTQFLPSEFYKYAVDFDGDGAHRYLDIDPRRARFRCQAACRQGLATRQGLGDGSARAGESRLHHRRSGQRHADWGMAQRSDISRRTAASCRPISSPSPPRC